MDSRLYPWGNDVPSCDKANYQRGICVGDTTAVGSYPQGVSPYQVFDMAGNVYEWVADWYDIYYYGLTPEKNPQGPALGNFRILRGGSWNYDVNSLYSSSRRYIVPTYYGKDIGFRCASSLDSLK